YLSSRRTYDEIEALVQRRLHHLYEVVGVAADEEDALYPLQAADLGKLTNLRTRDVLAWCHQYRERCIRAGGLVSANDVEVTAAAAEPTPRGDFEQRWNDFVTTFQSAPPDED